MKYGFRFAILLLLIATIWLYSASCGQSAFAQSTSQTVVENLTFHYYSLIQKAENGSYFVYDGADAVGPRLTTAFQTTLSCQMMGTRSGFTYWSAAIVWGIELQKDVHVLGNVEIRAYISSTFKGFGFFDGGGYGMGLVDIDENENIVEEIITEGPQSWMENPFTATPQLYKLNVNVDYIFKKGHYLGFFVGAGATIQGFTFTVYFDSQDRNSGASLPVVESTTPPQLDHITIIPSSKILQIGTTQQFSAQGYDQNNNPISGLNFSWTATGGIGSVNPTSGQTTTFIGSTAGVGSLSATTTYGGVTKSGSASITVTTTLPDPTPPTITHTPISAANDGQTITISATITDNVAVTEAKLYYKKSSETNFASITMTPSGNSYAATVPASIVTTAGVQYYINATDGTNFSTHPATNPATSPHTIIVILMNIPPTAATLNNPSDITQNSMKLTWTQNTEADFARYEIYQSTTSGTLGTKIYIIADRSTTSYTLTDLSADTTYYFTIRVVDTAGLFGDSVQVSGRTTQSSQADGTESTPPWVWWAVAGAVTISAVLAITILVLRQRKK